MKFFFPSVSSGAGFTQSLSRLQGQRKRGREGGETQTRNRPQATMTVHPGFDEKKNRPPRLSV